MSVSIENDSDFVLNVEVPKARRVLGLFPASKAIRQQMTTLDQAQRYVEWFIAADRDELRRAALQGGL